MVKESKRKSLNL